MVVQVYLLTSWSLDNQKERQPREKKKTLTDKVEKIS